MTDSVHNHVDGQARDVIQAATVNLTLHGAAADHLDRAADALAEFVEAQWRGEANVRGLNGPGRMAVEWEARWAPDGGSCAALVLVSLSSWGRWTVARIHLAGRRRLPGDVMTFLEDAHLLGVLRQVGGVHQFRHAATT